MNHHVKGGYFNMKQEELYGEDYYERGVEKKISGYTNYSYMPTRSYEEASTLLSRWDNEILSIGSMYRPITILDFGCAKGYLVHALRQLGFDAYGYDISEYAREHAHPRVKDFINSEKPDYYDYIICKDVMEHIPEEQIFETLYSIKSVLKEEALFVIPLGDKNDKGVDQFRIREYEMDVTHVTKKDEDWWIDKFREAGFEIVDFKYKFGDIKKKWQEFEHGNGFFFVRPKE